jgi:hypothetical protein
MNRQVMNTVNGGIFAEEKALAKKKNKGESILYVMGTRWQY